MNVKLKKSLKIVTLLVSALLIATVSADVYNYMFLNAAIGVEGLNLAWAAGNDGLTYTPSGATCSISGLKGPAGGTRTYFDAVRLTATGAETFNLQVESVTGTDTNQIDSIVVRLNDTATNTIKGTLTVWASGAQGSTPVTGLSMVNGDIWRLEWEIRWKSTATTETASVVLKVVIPP
jgi:hypothetical protein